MVTDTVPENYIQIIESLKSGLSLETAIELFQVNTEKFDENNFIAWIKELTNKRALIYKI